MNRILIFLAASVLFAACEETIELDITQTPPVYIVEGVVTDQLKNHYVKVNRSLGFYEDGRTPPVSNAVVVVRDNQGNTFPYQYNSEDSTYYAESAFAGVEGRIYSLEISLEDAQITGVDTLKRVTPIDRAAWRINERQQRNPIDEGYFYEIVMSAKEPKETVDYYLFHFYRNDTIQRFDNKTGVFIADDIFIREDIDNLQAPVYYSEGDTARFEMLSISHRVFVFYNDLSLLLTNDGGMFSSIPANPRTNLSGENVIGCFQASALVDAEFVVGDPEYELEE